MARGGRDATGDRGGEHGRVPSRGGSFQEPLPARDHNASGRVEHVWFIYDLTRSIVIRTTR